MGDFALVGPAAYCPKCEAWGTEDICFASDMAQRKIKRRLYRCINGHSFYWPPPPTLEESSKEKGPGGKPKSKLARPEGKSCWYCNRIRGHTAGCQAVNRPRQGYNQGDAETGP